VFVEHARGGSPLHQTSARLSAGRRLPSPAVSHAPDARSSVIQCPILLPHRLTTSAHSEHDGIRGARCGSGSCFR
jgi:hypothetical protein